jgi:hypothetical protein
MPAPQFGHEPMLSARIRAGSKFKRFLYFVLMYVRCVGTSHKDNVSTFQRFMDDLRFAYLDDIHIFSRSLEEQHLRAPFGRLQTYGININPTKCIFRASEVTFLGYKISTELVSSYPVTSCQLWRATNSPCMHRRLCGVRRPCDWMRTLDSGAGENVMEWCLGGSSVGQKAPLKVENAQEMT